MPCRRALAASVLALALAVPESARAQATQRLAPVGGRTTLVGGTGLVFGHDSASAFLNPATVVRIDKNRLSFSVDFYYLSLTESDAWYQPGTIDRARFGDVRREGNTAVSAFDFDSLPGSLCLFFGAGDLPFVSSDSKTELRARQARLGFCLASIQYNAFTFNDESYAQTTPTGVSRQAQNLRQTFRRLAFGPTYAMWLDNRLVVGASVHASRSSHRSIIGATSATYAGGPDAISSSFYNVSRGDSHELTATLGLTYRISRRQSVAIALQSPSLHVFGGGGINHHTQYRGAGSGESTFSADGSFVTRTPPRVAIGTGVEASWGSAEVNVAFHAPIGEVFSADLEGRALEVINDGRPVDQSRRAHFATPALGSVNFGVGGEAYTSERISLLGGLSADATIVPKGQLRADPFNFYPSRMHRVAASFGVASHGTGGDLLIGLEGSYGWGERLTPNMYQVPAMLDIADQRQIGLLFVLAGSTSFRSFKTAVENVKKVIDPAENDKDKDKEQKPSDPRR